MAKSYSQVSLYEKCAFAYHCKYKAKEPGTKSEAMERGIKIHSKIDNYLKGKRKTLTKKIVHPAAKKFIDNLKKFNGGSEEFWHFDNQWNFVEDWDWLVVKMDAYWVPENSILRIVDFKTGKPYKTHQDQLHLYATAGLAAYDCKTVESFALYTDTGASTFFKYDRKEHKKMMKLWDFRIERLEKEKDFKMHPGHHCKWCIYGKSKGGPCSYG